MKDMTPIYNYLIDGGFGLNILVYSGDDDDVCATVGTQVGVLLLGWLWVSGIGVGSWVGLGGAGIGAAVVVFESCRCSRAGSSFPSPQHQRQRTATVADECEAINKHKLKGCVMPFLALPCSFLLFLALVGVGVGFLRDARGTQ